jgi:type IV secretory pathway VirB2 component (pilin)
MSGFVWNAIGWNPISTESNDIDDRRIKDMTRFDDSEIKDWLREIRIEKICRLPQSIPKKMKPNLINRGLSMTLSFKNLRTQTPFLLASLVSTSPAFAGVETMMSNLQATLLEIVAPAVCICGLVFAGFKLAMGDESAKHMLLWSCIGTVLAFSAPSLLTYLQTRVAS